MPGRKGLLWHTYAAKLTLYIEREKQQHVGERQHQTPEWAAGHLDRGDLSALLGRDELMVQLSLPALGSGWGKEAVNGSLVG